MQLPSPKQKRQLCPLKLKAEIKRISRVCSSSTESLHSLYLLQQRDKVPLTHQSSQPAPCVLQLLRSRDTAQALSLHQLPSQILRACTCPLLAAPSAAPPGPGGSAPCNESTLLDPGAKPPGYPDSQVEKCREDPGIERGERVNSVFAQGRCLSKDVEHTVVLPVFPLPGESITAVLSLRSISTHFIHFFLKTYSLLKPQQLTCTWLTFLTRLRT